MNNTVFFFLLVLLAVGRLDAQEQIRYTQSAPEIDMVKGLQAAYNTGAWDKIAAFYHADAVVNHNGDTLLVSAVPASMEAGTDRFAYYSLNLFPTELERIINDRGEVWVNSWGKWRGVIKGATDTLTLSVHLVYQVKDGKISHEFAYYDKTAMERALAEASWGDDALLLIRQDFVKKGSEAAYEGTVKRYIKALNDRAIPGINWVSVKGQDTAIVMHQVPLSSLLDVHKIRAEELQGQEQLDANELGKIREAFLASITERKDFVVRRHAKRTYWPTEGIGGEVGYMNLITMACTPENIPTLFQLIDEGVQIARDGKSSLPFAIFTYELGGDMTEVAVVEYARNAADFATRKKQDTEVYSTEKGAAWYAKLKKIITKYEETKYQTAPDLSRSAER